MSATAVIGDLLVSLFVEHPDAAILVILGGGGYYELHYGRIDQMMTNQQVLGTAVYSLLRDSDDHDAEQFRRDLWGDDGEGQPYPGDWDRDPAEPPAGRGD